MSDEWMDDRTGIRSNDSSDGEDAVDVTDPGLGGPALDMLRARRDHDGRAGPGGYSDYGGLMGGGDQGSAFRRGSSGREEKAPYGELPPCQSHECEFIVEDVLSYSAGQTTRSASKTVGNFRFRLLVFPSGTHSTHGNQVSVFVEADPQGTDDLDPRWVFHGVKYQISVVNWLDYRRSVTKTDTWSFSKEGIDRGWHDMVRVADLTPESGWVNEQGSLCLRGMVYVRQADSIIVGNDYNTKKETGYVGLKNHGATCYMNGLLQSLFHVGQFRDIVYSIDCDGKDGKDVDEVDVGEEGSLPLIQALQNVFFKLQTCDEAVTCRELMKSFGWDTTDAFTQHDAQELNRILCDRLEEQMKGTHMDGSIKKLFEGEMENYIQCCDIDYKSTRSETFYDIQLNIKGESGEEFRTIEESLRNFTAEETLEGDNAYEAEGHGKQRAKKGIKFERFPPVLNLQLKRFHFDLEKLDMVKLNLEFKFQTRLDLNEFAPDAGVYALHAVVVHSGDVNAGHYYAFIKPTPDSGWVKFDDDTVTPCSEYAAVEDNFGGNDALCWNYFDRLPRDLKSAQAPTRPRINNAYMLVYVREDMADEILRVPDPRKTNMRMVDRFERQVQLSEQRKREKVEHQSKIQVRLVFEKDLVKMHGFWDHQEVPYSHTLKMGRDQPIKELLQEIEHYCGVSAANLALFSLHYRNTPPQVRFFTFLPANSVLRSHIPPINAPHFDFNDPYLVILAVASRGYDIQSLQWKPSSRDQKPDELCRWQDDTVTLLIVKYFCPKFSKVVTLGCYYTSSSDPLELMVKEQEHWVQERLQQYIDRKEVAALPEDSSSYSWECWEELSEKDIQPRDTKRVLYQEKLFSGDVIIWQPYPKEEEEDTSQTDVAGNEAPVYPLNTVADWAAHTTNAIDVTVVLHDSHQPLAVDGVVANGVWVPPRPQSASRDVSKEESIEDATLTASPCEFNMPIEKELKMDLRWHLSHMTAQIAKSFGLESRSESIWLFHDAPSTSPEDPLNSHVTRNGQTTLKDVQRSALRTSTSTKKGVCFHAVELPHSMADVLGPQKHGDNMYVFFVRFYDDAVREVGNASVSVPLSGTAQDIINEAQKHLKPEWGLRPNGPYRLLEAADARLAKMYAPSAPVGSLLCLNKSNVFFNSLRLENSNDADVSSGGQWSGGREPGLVELYHSDRSSGTAFGQPVLMTVSPGEKAATLKQKVKQKLNVPEGEMKSWRFIRSSRHVKHHLKDDDEVLDGESDTVVCMEHSHPNPSINLARSTRYNKPLTIK